MFSLLAPAKINLYLKVSYRRPDGYHEIDTVMQAISLFDRLSFYPDSKLRVLTKGRRIPQKDNLVTKALDLLKAYTGVKKGICVVIEKKIPVAAGLGGGSSDAAAALMGACHLWQIPAKLSLLSFLGSQIGSDVPFFFTSGQARAQSRGEILSPYPLPVDYRLALVCPKFSISTPWAYRELNLPLTSPNPAGNFLRTKKEKVIGEDLRNSTHALHFSNDLEAPVIRRFPEIEGIKKAFLAAGWEPALMSGSGPAVWAAFPKNMEGKKLPRQKERPAAMIRKLLAQSGITTKFDLFVVRPLISCANAPVGGQPA